MHLKILREVSTESAITDSQQATFGTATFEYLQSQENSQVTRMKMNTNVVSVCLAFTTLLYTVTQYGMASAATTIGSAESRTADGSTTVTVDFSNVSKSKSTVAAATVTQSSLNVTSAITNEAYKDGSDELKQDETNAAVVTKVSSFSLASVSVVLLSLYGSSLL